MPESLSEPLSELELEASLSEIPELVLELSEAIRPLSQRARSLEGVFRRDRTVTVKSSLDLALLLLPLVLLSLWCDDVVEADAGVSTGDVWAAVDEFEEVTVTAVSYIFPLSALGSWW